MQNIEYINELDDISFLKVILIEEEHKIRSKIKDLTKYIEVQNYKNTVRNLKKLEKKGQLTESIKKDTYKYLEYLQEFKEVIEYIECKKALCDYQKYKEKISKLEIDKKGRVYQAKEKVPFKIYKLETLITHLFKIKEEANYRPIITEEELEIYRAIVKYHLQSYEHYKEDIITKSNFLGIAIYQNPKDYTVEDIAPGMYNLKKSNNSTYSYKDGIITLNKPITLNDSLTEREENAFYNEETYRALGLEKEQIHKIKRKKTNE